MDKLSTLLQRVESAASQLETGVDRLQVAQQLRAALGEAKHGDGLSVFGLPAPQALKFAGAALAAAQAFGAGLVPVPEEDPRFVLKEWIGARNVDVSEEETDVLMAQAEAPQTLHMNLRGQLLHTARAMWAYRALAKMRGEYWPADDVIGIERVDGVTAAMAARGA